MIKHIVFWRLKDFAVGSNKNTNALKMIEKLEPMQGKINGLVSLQVGLNKNESADAYDVCLITEHHSWDDLTFYQNHPLHKEVATFIGDISQSRSLVDFEF